MRLPVPDPTLAETSPVSSAPSRYRSVADYIDLPSDRQSWLLEPILPTGGMVSIYAHPKVGKSNWAIQLCQAIADPRESQLLGFKVRQHGPVLYIQLDTPRSLWQERFLKLQSLGIDFSPEFALYDRDDAPFPFNILSPTEGQAWLAEKCRLVNPVLVVIDTLIECHEKDENSTQEMKLVINALQHTVSPAALLLITHSKKDNPMFEMSVIGGLRGATGIAGKMDTIMQLNKSSMKMEGRAMAETSLALHQDPDSHLWLLDGDHAQGGSVISAKGDIAKKALKLAAATGMSLPLASARVKRQLAAALV